MRSDLQAIVSRNLKTPKPALEAIAMVATRSGFKFRPRDETSDLKANCHTRGISIGSQLGTVERPLYGAVKTHPRLGQLGIGTPKKR